MGMEFDDGCDDGYATCLAAMPLMFGLARVLVIALVMVMVFVLVMVLAIVLIIVLTCCSYLLVCCWCFRSGSYNCSCYC